MESKLKRYRGAGDVERLKEEFERKTRSVPPTMEYVRNLILDARLLLRMVTDPDSGLSDEAREDFICALWYFIDPKDSIPDWVPLLGLLDDYRVIKYVKEKHREEIEGYLSRTRVFMTNSL